MHVNTKLYLGSLADAYDLLCEKGLSHCDPIPEPYWAYTFTDNRDLILFVLDFGTEHWIGGNTMLVPDHLKQDAEAVLQHWRLSACVHRCEMFLMEVWGHNDGAALDAAFT